MEKAHDNVNFIDYKSQRILSIQSHVVSGYVGNKAAVFPLQLLGFDVDVVNSVHFSNHTGYKHGFEGDVLKGEQLHSIIQGMRRNDLLLDIDHILTGYMGSASFLETVVDVVKLIRSDVREKLPKRVRYVCDPVLGDKGKFYVPEALVQLYLDKVIPIADVLTPNQFEVEKLTGINVRTIDDAKRACHVLHQMGPSLVIITSMELDSNKDSNLMTIMASQMQQSIAEISQEPKQCTWKIECPIIDGHFTGTGDLCAALFLAHTTNYEKPGNSLRDVPDALERVINTMFAVLQRTSEAASETIKSRELKLIQSNDVILNPPSVLKADVT